MLEVIKSKIDVHIQYATNNPILYTVIIIAAIGIVYALGGFDSLSDKE